MTQSIARNQMTGLNDAEVRSERKALRRRRQQALLLVLPLLAFIFFSFVAPITTRLYRSIYNPSVPDLNPQTNLAPSQWHAQSSPPPPPLNPLPRALPTLAQTPPPGTPAAGAHRHASGG